MDTDTSQKYGKDRWCDILERRRSSSDLLWLAFHSWSAAQYKCSKNRNFKEIRDATFNHPDVDMLIMESPLNRRKVEVILDEMCHSWSLPTIRFVGYFVTKIMKSIYRHVWIDDYIEIPRDFPISFPAQERSLKEVLDRISTECPVLLMPTHRSYADFIIFSYLCFDLNLPLPSIAAGIDFLSLNQVASLLRSCGAFFIRRSFKDDSLYWSTFCAYIETLIEGGERPLEFFIEGTRSRSGKSLPPKTGLLGVALNLFLSGRLNDLIILPVSISYDRTLEEELYAKELAAADFVQNPSCGSKPKETTTHLISGAQKILSQDFGSIHLKFCSPLSVRQLSYSFSGGDARLQLRRPAQRSNDIRRSFVDSVAKKIVTLQVNNLVLSTFPFLAMNVLTSLPSNDPYIYCSSSEIVRDIRDLTSLVPRKCLSHFNLGIELENDFDECLVIHKNLIKKRKTCVDGISWPSPAQFDLAFSNDSLTKIQLRHYANQSLQLIIDLAIVCKSSCDWKTYVSIKRLLCFEFVFCESEMETKFNESCLKFSNLSDKTRSTLNSHINFFLKSYLNVIENILNTKLQLINCNQESHRLTTKQLVNEIQRDLDIQSDIVSNAINLMISRAIMDRDEKNRLFLSNEVELRKLFHEISNLCNLEISWQSQAKL